MRAFALPFLIVSLAACGSEPAAPDPPPDPDRVLSLLLISGADQRAFTGEALDRAVFVRVQDQFGRPAAGVAVRFSVVAGDGTVATGEPTTSGTGLAATNWRLGPIPGAQRLSVSIPSATAAAVEISATAIDPRDADVIIVRGAADRMVTLMISPTEHFDPEDPVPVELRGLVVGDTVLRILPLDEIGAGERCDQVIAFANGRAPALVRPEFTAGPDTIPVVLADELAIPLTVWVLRNPFPGQDFAATASGVQRDLDVLASFWSVWYFGLRLGDVRIVDLSDDPTLLGCNTVPTPDPGRINVYYGAFEPGISQFGGFACAPNRALMRPHGSPLTPGRILLAHELGHLFGLGHVTDPANFMHSTAVGSGATLGQVFRTHFFSFSEVNSVYGLRPNDGQGACHVPPL